LTQYGNPSSIYSLGQEAHRAIEGARRSLAVLINCTPRRIVFTSGGSEANNFVIKGMAFAASDGKNHIVTSSIEHPSVKGVCAWLEQRGFSVTYLPVDGDGLVHAEDLAEAITDRTFLVTIMAANNETGSIQPIPKLAEVARAKSVLFHTDAVQAVGKIPVDVDAWAVDLLTLSGHKFSGPKGAGAIFIRKGLDLPQPLIHGGKQERGLRGGTENLVSLVGMGLAAHQAGNRLNEMGGRVRAMRDMLYEGICRIEPRTRLNGHPEKRLPNTLNVCLPGIRGESLVLALDSRGIFFSSGSACKSGSPEPSHVLLAMGLSEEQAHCSVRFSLGMDNTSEEIDRTLDALQDVLHTSVPAVRFVSCR
jgi:cysteine desulfurase NifS